MSLYSQFQTDQKLEKEGILLEYGTNSKGDPVRFRISRAGGSNQHYAKRLEVLAKPLRRQLQTETADVAALERLLRQVYAETIVLGWEGVEDEHGNELSFSVENCKKLFDDLPDLFKDIQEQSQRVALFLKELKAFDSKN
jgi:hypothetical protein